MRTAERSEFLSRSCFRVPGAELVTVRAILLSLMPLDRGGSIDSQGGPGARA